MNKYTELLDLINTKKRWGSDSDFFCDVISKSTIRIIELYYEDLETGNIIRILPLLRQVQENCVALLGFGTNTLTVKEFAESKLDPKRIIRRILASGKEDEDKVIRLSEYMKGIKCALDKYAHTNLDGLMLLFIEDHQTYETMKFSKLVVQFVISMVEILFISMANHLYKTKMALPVLNQIGHELKGLGSLRYTADKLPEGHKEFFGNSEVLKDYFRKLIVQFKEQIKVSQDFFKEGKEA